MHDLQQELLELKEQALAATQRADGAFYEDYLDDEAMAVVPQGTFDKAAIVRQMASPRSAFRSDSVADERALVLTPECDLVTYRATYPKGDVMVTTVYVKRDGRWKGIFYQQTPLQATGAAR